jgi:hypothetical protein
LAKSPGPGTDLIEDRKDLRKIFAGSRPSAIPFVGIGAAALNSLAVPLCALRQLVGTLVDLFAFLRYQVSDRVHTLLSRFFIRPAKES